MVDNSFEIKHPTSNHNYHFFRNPRDESEVLCAYFSSNTNNEETKDYKKIADLSDKERNELLEKCKATNFLKGDAEVYHKRLKKLFEKYPVEK